MSRPSITLQNYLVIEGLDSGTIGTDIDDCSQKVSFIDVRRPHFLLLQIHGSSDVITINDKKTKQMFRKKIKYKSQKTIEMFE